MICGENLRPTWRMHAFRDTSVCCWHSHGQRRSQGSKFAMQSWYGVSARITHPFFPSFPFPPPFLPLPTSPVTAKVLWTQTRSNRLSYITLLPRWEKERRINAWQEDGAAGWWYTTTLLRTADSSLPLPTSFMIMETLKLPPLARQKTPGCPVNMGCLHFR